MELDISLKNRQKEKISLNKKLIISFSIPMSIFIIIMAFLVNIMFKVAFRDYLEIKHKQIIEIIDLEIHKYYTENKWDVEGIKKLSEDALSNGIVLTIQDSDNNTIWSAKDNEKKYKEILSNMQNITNELNKLWKKDIKSNDKAPIYNDKGDLIGYRSLEYCNESYLMYDEIIFIYAIRKILIIMVVVCIFTILWMTIYTSKNIIEPVKSVSKTTKLLENSNYKKLGQISDVKEINDLITSINNLSNSLRSQENIRKRLITDLSHELSTPITSMHGHLEAMIDGIWEPTEDRLKSINQELMRLNSLIDQLKNLNKLEHEPIHKSYTNLGELIYSIVNNMQARALMKNINIEYKQKELYGYVDKDKLSQVIINILVNAIKYTSNNKNIYISLYKESNYIYISIKDEGCGISKEDIDYIFERFYRCNKSRNRDDEGMGVGLTISNMIVREHCGSIIVKSEVNEGSEFIIRLPEK